MLRSASFNKENKLLEGGNSRRSSKVRFKEDRGKDESNGIPEVYSSDEENPAGRDTHQSNFTEIQKIRMKEHWTGPSSLSEQEYGVMLIEEKVCEIDLANAPVNQRRWFQQEITSS